MKTQLHNLKRRISELTGDRRGQTMIEYALLVGFLALAGALLLSGTGQNVGTVYTNVAQVLDADGTNGGAPVAGSPPSSPSDDGGDSGNDDSGGNDSDGNGGGNGNGNGNGNGKGNGDGKGNGNGNGNNNGNAGGNGKGNGNGGKK